MAAHVLAPIADLNAFLLGTTVHARWYPFPLLTTLHAARIAVVHQSLNARARTQLQAKRVAQGDAASPLPRTTWAYDLTAYLIMCWGGGVMATFLAAQTPVQFLSAHFFVHYASVYLLVGFFFRFVVPISPAVVRMVDTALIPIDGALRTHAVIMSVTMAKASPSLAVQNSLLIQVLCATIGATGGGQVAAMIDAHSLSGWSFQTPPVLRATSLVEVIDIVFAALCALVYGLTTLSHPGYQPALAYVHAIDASPKALLSPTGARALCTLLFTSAFAYRAAVLHWLAPAAAQPAGPNGRVVQSKAASTPAKGKKKTA